MPEYTPVIPTRFFHFLHLALAILLVPIASNNIVSADTLPDLGDSAMTILTPEHEELLGKQIMLDVRRRTTLVDDFVVLDYLHNLTQSLAQHSPRPLNNIQVYLVDDPNINAFALPGNHLAFHTGLIMAVDSEAELASVIAHELAHQTQRHIPRILERAKERTLPATAAMIAGLLIGGQAGIAAITSVNAAIISDQLTFNREFEKEADATGMQILHDGGFPAQAMPDFFRKLENQSRLSGSNAPEFLRTHPLSRNRIANSLSKAQTLQSQISASTHSQNDLTSVFELPFRLIKARIESRFTQNKANLEQKLDSQIATSEQVEKLVNTYALSQVKIKKHQFEQARYLSNEFEQQGANFLDSANTRTSNLDTLIRLMAYETLVETGEPSTASLQLKRLVDVRPHWPPATLAYANALIAEKNYLEASQLLKKELRHTPHPNWFYPTLIKATGLDGKTTKSKFLKAVHAEQNADFDTAITLLEELSKLPSEAISHYDISRVSALLTAVKRKKEKYANLKL